MIYKLIISFLCAWCSTYTISYGIFEWKSKNPTGAVAVFALCVPALAFTVGIWFCNIGV